MATPLIDRIRVVHEDDDLIVIDKPAGLLTMETDREHRKTVLAVLRSRLSHRRPPQRVFIVHRLDREASGLLVFAKSVEAQEGLQAQFKDHSAGRRYVAVVEGSVRQDEFTVRSLLAENAAFRVYTTRKTKIGKEAITHIRVAQRSSRYSILDVRLETGRKHQIRVHLADAGHPVVGDDVYGSRNNPLHRLALHGVHLEFRHPRTGRLKQFDSLPPKSFLSLIPSPTSKISA